MKNRHKIEIINIMDKANIPERIKEIIGQKMKSSTGCINIGRKIVRTRNEYVEEFFNDERGKTAMNKSVKCPGI